MPKAPVLPRPGRDAGYTLVGFLVVIAVIGNMIALLRPVLSSSVNGSPVYGSLGRKSHRPGSFRRVSIGTLFFTDPHTHAQANLIGLEQWLHLYLSDGKGRSWRFFAPGRFAETK